MSDKFRLRVEVGTGSDKRTHSIRGREAWALEELVRAGEAGCTPIDTPGPRWSAYVHTLRHEFGLEIVTFHEPHAGDFPGTHARYVLRSQVRLRALCVGTK